MTVAESKGFTHLLPPHPDTCQECGRMHDAHEAHDKNSLFYQVKFRMEKGRFPSWEDACAHLSEGDRKKWMDAIARIGMEDGRGNEGFQG